VGEKLKENSKSISNNPEPEEPEIPEVLNQAQAFTLITKSFMAIAASLDTFAFIAEKWALKNNVLSEKDLE
jgi:hypothetical protein